MKQAARMGVWLALATTSCGDGAAKQTDRTATPVCGNGAVEGAETCDDGNLRSHDGCSSACSEEVLLWSELATDSTPPARFGHAIAFDSRRGVVVLFGGFVAEGKVAIGDTWELDGATWTKINTAASPPPLYYSRMTFDSARGVMVLFGGFDGAAEVDGTWEYDGNDWTSVQPTTTPPGRYHHAMVFDEARGAVMMHGGAQINDVCLGDTWAYDGVDWVEDATGEGGPEGFGFAMGYDAGRGRTVLFGGRDCVGTAASDTTWEYNGTDWSELPIGAPAHRRYMPMVFDSVQGVLVMFGGLDGTNACSDETWTFDGSVWTQLAEVSALGARRFHAMVYDSLRRRVVTVQGNDCAHTVDVTSVLQYGSDLPDEVCDNNADDDADGRVDCSDPDCEGLACFGGTCSAGHCG